MATHTLVTEHRPFVRAALRRLGVAGSALDDAEQEVFLVLVRRRADFDPSRGSSERGWIWGICRNVASAHRRATRRRGGCESADERGARPPFEERIAAVQALHTLDEDSRALWLGRCEGRSAAELAASLDLPLTTVQWRLRQAKRSLRATLRGLERGGQAVVTWLLRPQYGFGPVLAPTLPAFALSSAPAEPMQLPAEAERPRAAAHAPTEHRPVEHLSVRPPPREHAPLPERPLLTERPSPPATATTVVGVVTERAPRIRRERKVGRVSLGDPSVE